MTLKIRILRCSRRLFIILVSLTVTSLSEKILISTKCKHGFMSNTIKKSWTVSNLHLLHCTDTLLWSLEFILASTISAILLLADDGIYHYKVKCYIGQVSLRFVNLKRSLVPHFAHIMLTILLLNQYLSMYCTKSVKYFV